MPREPLDTASGEASEKVGYGRPPLEHRIKSGEVRNRWGRRGKPKPQLDFLDELVVITIDGKPRQITRQQALDYFLFAKAAKGHVPAIRQIEDRARQRRAGLPDSVSTELTPDLDRFVRRSAERLTGKEGA